MEDKIFILCDDRYDYVANVSGDYDIKLRHSNDENWTNTTRGSEIGNLTDDGDNIIINLGDKTMTLDYSEAYELFIMLDLKVKLDVDSFGVIDYLKKI